VELAHRTFIPPFLTQGTVISSQIGSGREGERREGEKGGRREGEWERGGRISTSSFFLLPSSF
jgi:hypothetical protein